MSNAGAIVSAQNESRLFWSGKDRQTPDYASPRGSRGRLVSHWVSPVLALDETESRLLISDKPQPYTVDDRS